MVESNILIEKNTTKKAVKKRVKFIWEGSSLQSQHCCLTVFTYLDYRQNIKKLIICLNSAGVKYYNTMVKKSPYFQDNLRLLFPSKHSFVTPKSIQQMVYKPVNVGHLNQVFLSASPSSNFLSSQEMYDLYIMEIDLNHLRTQITIEQLVLREHFIIGVEVEAEAEQRIKNARRVLELANFSINVFSVKVQQNSVYEWAKIYFTELKPDMCMSLFDTAKLEKVPKEKVVFGFLRCIGIQLLSLIVMPKPEGL